MAFDLDLDLGRWGNSEVETGLFRQSMLGGKGLLGRLGFREYTEQGGLLFGCNKGYTRGSNWS